jgi:hypothetical protein
MVRRRQRSKPPPGPGGPAGDADWLRSQGEKTDHEHVAVIDLRRSYFSVRESFRVGGRRVRSSRAGSWKALEGRRPRIGQDGFFEGTSEAQRKRDTGASDRSSITGNAIIPAIAMAAKMATA